MIKITALNEESEEEESEIEGEVTREALEEIALQQYARTLELQKKGNLKDALQLLKDLLDTELLYDVKKTEDHENVSRSLLNLKYLCYRNIASISAQLEEYDAAVEAYLEASNLDSTDITLWYRLGMISLKIEKFDLALYAFQRGVECNSRHWPCLDHLITILLGLGEYNECIFTIYKALELDPDYLRGRVYRKYIFTDYPHVQQYLSLINSLYKWNHQMDENFDGEECENLLSEAKTINETFIKQVMESKVVERLPILSLNKPIENWTWMSVGESIVDMHMHISEKLLSHACIVKVSQPEEKISLGILSDMEVDCFETKVVNGVDNLQTENKVNIDKTQEDKLDKTGNESDKIDVDTDVPIQDVNKSSNEGKDVKKAATRRRGSSVSFLKQWEWCKRKSSRKKNSNKPDPNETIYDTLKRMLPQHLQCDDNRPDRPKKDLKGDDSLDTMDLYKLFEEKEKSAAEMNTSECKDVEIIYFNTEKEQTDVQAFIQKYVESTCDIITMVDDYVLTLSKFWQSTWPDGLGDIYMEANWCSRQHSDPPLGYTNEENVLKHFVEINLMHLEIGINKLLEDQDAKNGNVETELIDLLKILCARREELGKDALTMTIRYLWVKCHSLLYKDQIEFALDCLYYIIYELNCLDEEGNVFSLKVPNFTKWPFVTKNNCIDLIKSLERNKQLATVPSLYEFGKYEEVVHILQDSFKYCQVQASKQEWSSMSLDWAVQLVTLIESLWALDNTDQCFLWAATCLHEALKQYMQCEQGTDDYKKWGLAVVKALLCIEHILKQEGSGYLDVLSDKNMARLVQDIIQVIVHQLDDSNTSQELPLNTLAGWILLHYVFQREEDCGRMKKKEVTDLLTESDIPVSLMILFMAHDNLGRKSWCCINDGQLLYFTLKTVISRLRSPALSSCVEIIGQYLEQCVFCLFGHPSKKTKLRYLMDHNVSPFKMDWEWAQQIFELYRPEEMPEFNSYRLGSITAETEQLFQRMLSLAPSSLDPQPHYAEVIIFIEGKKTKLPDVNIQLPYKMKDIYYLLADFYLKNNETVKALKYYTFDIVITKNRFNSWAGTALARGSLLETKLNSCESFRTEMEYLNRAAAVECCFKQALEIDSSHSMLWIEYGAFVYGVHSFCSRMLKQASESLSMESFEVLENRKECMLNTANRCFVKAHRQWMAECQADDKGPQDERWLHYYMLGKISEKKNEAPQKYLEYYQKAGKFLEENNATYPTKINYNNPQNLSVEALEIHYRIHAAILKYIEQHENKVIYTTAGKSFKECLDLCALGPFSLKKKNSKDLTAEKELNNETKSSVEIPTVEGNTDQSTLKRTHSEIIETEECEAKKPKTIHPVNESDNIENESSKNNSDQSKADTNDEQVKTTDDNEKPIVEKSESKETNGKITGFESDLNSNGNEEITTAETSAGEDSKKNSELENIKSPHPVESDIPSSTPSNGEEKVKTPETTATESDSNKPAKDSENTSNTATSKGNSSSDSSTDSSSEDSSSSSSSSSSDDSGNEKQTPTEMSQEEINKVISTCLENLEDCVSRFPQHYKALYRLAHFHFYYKRDRNISRCRDLMLGTFISKSGIKLQGLFCERKNSNFFNGIWRIPAGEVDRAGSFASHMSRCILITMEILKEINDYKTLLDLSLHLQHTPDAEKKYLRESERIELYQQAISLCFRSIKGLITKFSKIHGNISEKQKLSNLMLDIYKAYQRVQKHLPPKAQTFGGLLVDCYKLYSGKGDSENILEKSIKKCQSIIVSMRQHAHAAASVNNSHSENVSAPASTPATAPPVAPILPLVNPPPPKKSKPIVPIIPATSFLPHVDTPVSYPNLTNPYLSYLPMMDRSFLSALSNFDQAAAALYMSNMGSLANMPSSTSPNLQADLLRQMISSNYDSAYMQAPKPKYNPSSAPCKTKSSASVSRSNISKSSNVQSTNKQTTSASTKSSIGSTNTSNNKSFNNFPSAQQQSAPKKPLHNDGVKATAPSASVSPAPTAQNFFSSTSNSAQPAHITPISPGPSNGSAQPAHQSTTSTVNAALHTKPPGPHQQVSPGKTLQEKLAERQKQNPAVPKSSAVSAAFSGKIPSSLTITKGPTEEQKQYKETLSKNMRDIRKSVQFAGPTEKLAQPKKIIDSSEVIVLDDD